jgi:hypothetical protein
MTEASVYQIGPETGRGPTGEQSSASTVRTAETDDVGEEYLAEAVVRLIRKNRAVRQAVLDVVRCCPNVKWET